MNHTKNILWLAAVLPTAVSAQVASFTEAQLDSIERSVDLGQVVVTGTRTPKLLANSPILTRVITSEEIRKIDATNISDLLQSELPGIEFSYSMNQQVSLNMQGFGGTSILFLVDGERLAGETLDNVDYNRLNLNNVGRIEIVKGAASSLYGSSAVGGVVNLISRESKEPWTLNVNGKYGEHNEQRYGAVATFHRGSVTSATTAQYTTVDSYDFKNEGDYSRFYGGYTYDVKERLTYRPTERLKLIGRAGYFFRQRNSAATTRDRYRDFSGGLRGLYNFSKDKNLELSYTFDQYDKSDYQVQTASDVRKYSNVQNSGRALYNQTFAERHILTLGGDVMRDYLESYQFADGGHRSQVTADAFAQLDLNFLQNFNLIAGARYDYFSESDLDHLSTKLSMMYRLGDLRLRASYAGGFRAPTLKEMYMDFDMASIFTIYGNEELKPEQSHNFQLSAEYSRGLFNASLGGFYNNVDDRITTAWSQALGGMLYSNIDRVRIAGLEANLCARTAWGLGARLSYVYTHEQVAAGQPYTSSTRPHTATARVDYGHHWRHYGLDIALSGRALSKVDVDEYTSTTSYEETERVTYPGYTMWRLNLTHHLGRAARVTMEVDNLFNYVPKYFYSNSPTTNGMTFALGVSLDIDRWFDQ
jgi:outer membrane receptor for ferrienterochelin and colicins